MKKIKRMIIRWALKQLKPLLPRLGDLTYEGLAKWGIGDLMINERTGEYAVYIDPEL